MPEPNAQLIDALRLRESRQEHVYGIRTADEHLRPVLQCVDDSLCCSLKLGGEGKEWDRGSMLKAAEQRLVYANDDMVFDQETLDTSEAGIKAFCKEIGIEPPPRTIMTFRAVITTPKKDRDGDILRTDGAKVDKSGPLLWHHLLVMPVGKLLRVLNHTSKQLSAAFAVIDSQLGNDVAQLIEFGALRISHGFLPLEFEPLKQKPDEMPGYDIKKFEVMETSVVTVPSNTDAVIEAFSRGKLANPLVKSFAKAVADKQPVLVPGYSLARDVGDVPSPPTGDEDEDARGDTDTKDTEPVQPVVPDGEEQPAVDVEAADKSGDATAGATEGADGRQAAPATPGDAVAGEQADDEPAAEPADKIADPPEIKQGRVLSKKNKSRLQSAQALIQEVLDTAADEDPVTEATEERSVTLDTVMRDLALCMVRDNRLNQVDLELIRGLCDRALQQNNGAKRTRKRLRKKYVTKQR